jgi:hypothetical protein
MKIKLTIHARRRAYQRLRIKAKHLLSLAYRALNLGNFFAKGKGEGICYLYGRLIFVFIEDKLVTVYTV